MTDTRDNKTSSENGEVQLRVHYRIVGSGRDLFKRDLPALLEGPETAWNASRALIDFGCALLHAPASNRIEASDVNAKTAEYVYLALLRRALVTAEATWGLLARGFEEPAFSQLRTLLDIHLNVRLVAADVSMRMARRLGAYHYLRGKRHGQKMLADRETSRSMLDEEAIRLATIETARSYAKHLESEVFDEIRDDLRNSNHWHGHSSVEQAFREAGEASDYFMSYDSFTSFVHASNVDYDFVDEGDAGVQLRPLVERDPARVQTSLGFLTFRLLEILRVIIDARGLPDMFSEEAARRGLARDGVTVAVDDVVLDDFSGIQQRVMEAFPLREPR